MKYTCHKVEYNTQTTMHPKPCTAAYKYLERLVRGINSHRNGPNIAHRDLEGCLIPGWQSHTASAGGSSRTFVLPALLIL